jgi:hypothetical protein
LASLHARSIFVDLRNSTGGFSHRLKLRVGEGLEPEIRNLVSKSSRSGGSQRNNFNGWYSGPCIGNRDATLTPIRDYGKHN